MSPKSFIILGYYFLRQLVLRALGLRRGLKAFLESYATSDSLYPLEPSDRATIAGASRCIYCNLCRRPKGLAWSPLPTVSSRSLYAGAMPHSHSESFDEQRCPQGVPLQALGNLGRAQAAPLN